RSRDPRLVSVTNDDEHLTHLDLLACCRGQTQDHTSAWRRDLHHGLIRLHLDQWLVRPHPVALLDQPAHDFTLVDPFTDIREAKFQCHTDLKRPGRGGWPRPHAQASAGSTFPVAAAETPCQNR